MGEVTTTIYENLVDPSQTQAEEAVESLNALTVSIADGFNYELLEKLFELNFKGVGSKSVIIMISSVNPLEDDQEWLYACKSCVDGNTGLFVNISNTVKYDGELTLVNSGILTLSAMAGIVHTVCSTGGSVLFRIWKNASGKRETTKEC